MASDVRLKEQLPDLTDLIVETYSSEDKINHLAAPNWLRILWAVKWRSRCLKINRMIKLAALKPPLEAWKTAQSGQWTVFWLPGRLHQQTA